MTTTDRELLERAAKAAGIDYDPGKSFPKKPEHTFFGLWLNIKGEPYEGQRRRWNPLTDDCDEARLEAALMLDCRWWPDDVTVGTHSEMYADHGGDKQKARRYAGVRAAAAMAGEGE